MRRPTYSGALAVATLALAVASPSIATDHLAGIWRATWPNGHATEVTIVDIDAQRRAIGSLCHQTPQGRYSYIDLHPDAILARYDQDGDTVQINRPPRSWNFRPGDNPNALTMSFRYAPHDPRVIDLARIDEQICAAQVHQLAPPPGATTGLSVTDTVPEDPGHWAIGVWRLTEDDKTVELAVTAVEDGHARGVYCNVEAGPTLGFHYLDPETGTSAKTSRKRVRFKIGDATVTFKRTKDADVIERTERRKGKTVKHNAGRTDESICVARLAPR